MSDGPRGGGGPREGTPEYDWLYGAGPGARPDPEVTQPMPSTGAANPDATRVLPTMPRPDGSRTPPPPATTPPPGRPPAPPPVPGPTPPPARSPRKPRRWARWVALALLAWGVYLVAVPWWAWTTVSQVPAFPPGERPAEQDGHDVPRRRQRLP